MDAIVQVVIGIIFIFSLLAILVTQINTFISNLLKWRSKNLKDGLQQLVTDKKLQVWLLTHPLINMVKQDLDPKLKFEEQMDEIVNSEVTELTYLSSETFINALIDILLVEADKLYKPLSDAVRIIKDEDTQSRMRELVRMLRSGFSEQTLRELRAIVEAIPEPAARENLIKAINGIEANLSKLNFKTDQIVPILEGVDKIKDLRLRRVLQTILVSANTLEDARNKLSGWFDDGMTRASHVYKKQMVYFSLAVSLALAVILNVDTLFISRSLWENPELRQSLAESAVQFDQGAASTQLIKPDSSDDEEITLEELQAEAELIGETVQDLLELQLPIGWEFTEVTDEMVTASRILGLPDPQSNSRNLWNLIPGNTSGWVGLWVQKIIGLLATTIAAPQGAPFWFDLLNRVASRGDTSTESAKG